MKIVEVDKTKKRNKKMTVKNLSLGDPIHPGEILREDYLEELGMSQNALAKAIHVPSNRINAICNGKRDITADTAARLGKYFGTTMKFWLNLQTAYEIDVFMSQTSSENIEEIEPLVVA
jgi:addiction module HigA family antidote